jgi:uncharacterized protein (DUF58 family)
VVTAQVGNVSQLHAGVLLAEDAIPSTLCGRPRFVLDEFGPGGRRELSYQIGSDTRGKFTIGPLRVRVADAFGLVETNRPLKVASTLLVAPRIVPLPRAAAPGSRLGEGDGSIRMISADARPRLPRLTDSRHRRCLRPHPAQELIR